eukprot:scaffold21210_cov78-Skeletonema_dohrnii-CCMP3373.AAC.2
MHRICSFFLILGLSQQQQLNKLIVELDSKGNTAPSYTRRKSKSQDATPNPNPLDLPEVQDSLSSHLLASLSQHPTLSKEGMIKVHGIIGEGKDSSERDHGEVEGG